MWIFGICLNSEQRTDLYSEWITRLADNIQWICRMSSWHACRFISIDTNNNKKLRCIFLTNTIYNFVFIYLHVVFSQHWQWLCRKKETDQKNTKIKMNEQKKMNHVTPNKKQPHEYHRNIIWTRQLKITSISSNSTDFITLLNCRHISYQRYESYIASSCGKNARNINITETLRTLYRPIPTISVFILYLKNKIK